MIEGMGVDRRSLAGLQNPAGDFYFLIIHNDLWRHNFIAGTLRQQCNSQAAENCSCQESLQRTHLSLVSNRRLTVALFGEDRKAAECFYVRS